MKFKNAPSNGGEQLLRYLNDYLSASALKEFLEGEGFHPQLGAFPPAEILRIIDCGRYPTSNLLDLGQAVYECGTDALERYDPYVRKLAASLYVYVRHARAWGGNWQGEYCYRLIADAIEQGDAEALEALKAFFEWLCTFVVADDPASDYPLYMSWLLVTSRLGREHETLVSDVVSYLQQRPSDRDYLIGDSYGFGVENWLELVECIRDMPDAERSLIWDLIDQPAAPNSGS